MKFFLIALLSLFTVNAQQNFPFADEVREISKKTDSIWDSERETIVFTGSSSIRFWKDLQERFPEKQILNTGFGGSQSSDLEHYLNELVLDYNPTQVFIYEGDNDINAKKKPKNILATITNITNSLKQRNPQMEIVLISAKPSISRWHLRGKYKRLNRRMHRYAIDTKGIYFADVWNTMLNNRRLKKDLFISDGLHMNSKGYDIWYEVIKNHIYKTNP
ncbi:G-D-S-L family lipolytic protein [Flagellimonas sp. 389]|uniref:SGNH/GDSL hydrolase family protein n=1 Tax=Flagellimonas sp. 389 TaxID=2835862 RepID=UPI001BD5391D|nr:SGNH/GDSL hydrolase family protein [Flagellimonas sp. 389]MBS9461548.1 G-D-S-L family lipolytic protein [Flagellimonas sp. 389]